MRQESLKENAILTDREPYLYVECARIDQEDSSLCMIQRNKKMQIPVSSAPTGAGSSILSKHCAAWRGFRPYGGG